MISKERVRITLTHSLDIIKGFYLFQKHPLQPFIPTFMEHYHYQSLVFEIVPYILITRVFFPVHIILRYVTFSK
jgi:hypothetical protein